MSPRPDDNTIIYVIMLAAIAALSAASHFAGRAQGAQSVTETCAKYGAYKTEKINMKCEVVK